MGDKVDKFCIFNVNDDVNHRAFSIDFEAYNYFVIRLNYDKGRFGCNIIFGEKLIALNNSQEWCVNAGKQYMTEALIKQNMRKC